MDAPVNLTATPNEVEVHIELDWDIDGLHYTGELIESSLPIPGIPYIVSGNTSNFLHDYDEACPYSGSQSPDVVYNWLAQPGIYYFDLCITDYDNKLYVYDQGLNLIACDDDSIYPEGGNAPIAASLNLQIETPGLYYIVVDGYGGYSGSYSLYMNYDNPNLVNDRLNRCANYSPGNVRSPSLLGYRIYRNGTPLADVGYDINSFLDLELFPFEEHCYTVRSVYQEGESLDSNESCTTIVTCPNPGDINSDGELNVLDVVVGINLILSNEWHPCADLNSDQVTDILDIVLLVGLILNP